MTQLRVNVDEKRYALLTQLLEALEIEYVPLETETTQRDWSDLPTVRGGGNLDHVNIRQYAYEDDEGQGTR
jgi:hypothetical protein